MTSGLPDFTVGFAVSGLEFLAMRDPEVIIDARFNEAMKTLYDCGCRRMRQVRVRPRNGDAEYFSVKGWKARHRNFGVTDDCQRDLAG